MRHRRPMLMSAVVALVLTTIGTASVIAAVQFRGPQPAYFVGLDGNVTSVENAADWVLRVIGSGLVSWSKRGVGIDNSFLDGTATQSEIVTLDFDNEGASSIGGGVPSLVTGTSIGVSGLDAGETLVVTAFYDDGSNSGPVVVTAGSLSAGRFQVLAGVGEFLDYVSIAAGPSTSVRLLLT